MQASEFFPLYYIVKKKIRTHLAPVLFIQPKTSKASDQWIFQFLFRYTFVYKNKLKFSFRSNLTRPLKKMQASEFFPLYYIVKKKIRMHLAPVLWSVSDATNLKIWAISNGYFDWLNRFEDLPLFIKSHVESRDVPEKKILYNTTRGRTHLLAFFLSGRVKLIVTSERLNIYIKCFHQSKPK
jgi:hypothetical protein